MHLDSKVTRIQAILPLVTATLLLGGAHATRAETIVSSLVNTQSFVTFPIGGWVGSPFTTDDQGWTLTSATVVMQLGTQLDFSRANVRLMSDNAGNPGTTLADLGTKDVRQTEQYAFTSSTTVTLEPATTYWVVVGNVLTNGGLNVAFSQQGTTFTNTGVPGASMAHVTSTGAITSNSPPTNWVNSAGIALLFAIEGTPQGVSLPDLMISAVDAQSAYVSWSTNFTGYTLQSTTNLLSGSWTALTNAPTVMSNRFTHLVDTTSPRQFFSLGRP